MADEYQPLPTTPMAKMLPPCPFGGTPGAPMKLGVTIHEKFEEDLSATTLEIIQDAKKLAEEADELFVKAREQHMKALKRSHNAKLVAAVANNKVREAESEAELKMSEEALHEAQEAADLFDKANADSVSAVQEVTATREEMYMAQKKLLEANHSLSALKSAKREDWLMMQDDGAKVNQMTQVTAMYSTFLSYAKGSNPDCPVMPWDLSKDQFDRFKKLYIIATDLSREEVMKKIKDLLAKSAERMQTKGSFWFEIPRRDIEHLDYCHTLEIPLLRRGKMVHRSFSDGRSKHSACATLWLLHHLYNNLKRKKILTEREVFYHGKHIFRTLKSAATCLTDICTMLECCSASLNVLPEQKGEVTGGLILHMQGGKEADANCPAGVELPEDIRDIARIEIDKEVRFILVVEKGTMYNFLRRENFHQNHKCLIVTGHGMPDERTRKFVRMLQEESTVPLFGIADPDAWGLVIIKTYAKGSVQLAHDTFSLATISLHWLGISTLDIEDIERLRSKKILNRCPRLTGDEITMLKNLCSPQFMLSPIWNQRILHMLNIDRKACFEDLHAFGENFVAYIYVPFLINRVMKSLGKTNGNGFGTKLSFDEVKKKTYNFGSQTLIGNGLYGELYSITLDQGEHVAVRKLKVPDSPKKLQKFRLQAATLLKLKHENLLDLYGFSTNEDQCLLAYEFATLGSLHDILHGEKGASASPLEWQQRVKIAIDIAKGLEYLHEKAHPSIIHGDIRPSNILLLENYKAKIGEFNIAKLSPDFYPIKAASTSAPSTSASDFNLARPCTDVSLISNYRAPECRGGEPTNKRSDIYSYGLVLSELFTGKKFSVDILPWKEFLINSDGRKEHSKNLLKEYVDEKLLGQWSSNELDKFAEVIVDCVQQHAILRPRISHIVEVLSFLDQQ